MSALLLGLLFAAAPPSSPEPRTTIFLQPVGSAIGPFLDTVWVSGGVQRLLFDDWSLVIDGAVVVSNGRRRVFADIAGSTSVSASVGMGWRAAGSGLSGFFVIPKIWGVVTWNLYDVGPSPVLGLPARGESWMGGEIGLGVDLALQARLGSFLIGGVLGLGLGVATEGGKTGADRDVFSLFGGNALRNRTRSSGVVIAFNANLLRIGFAF